MNRESNFDSVEQAVAVLWAYAARLTRLMLWVFIALAHLLALHLLALALWWNGVQPQSITAAVLNFLQSSTGAVLGAAGLSATTLVAGYLWLMRRLLEATSGALIGRLLGPPRD